MAFVVIHSDRKRVACAPSSPGATFEWRGFKGWDLPAGVMTWDRNTGASTFALMNGGKVRTVTEVLLEAAA